VTLATANKPARRTSNIRSGGRSARVVDVIRRATLEVLGEVGYDNLRMEEVARRAGVNKTTVYRRWPTRAALVADALHGMKAPAPPLTGDLAADLKHHLQASLRWLASPLGRAVARVVLQGDVAGELQVIVARMREQLLQQRQAILDAAVARGELPAGTDTRLVTETIHASIHSRVVRWGDEPSDALVESVLALVLAGARAGGAVRRGL